MPEIYKVANVEEAVTLADKFKDEGKYNWFRGQIKDWIPHSSMLRLRLKRDEDLLLKAKLKFQRFILWAQEKDELKYLFEDKDIHQLEAILQHYGFPTDYIDFTTEPSIAGFFACDTKSPPTNGNSCIYCLDIDDLMELWKIMKDYERENQKIEKIVIDVNNLWRLQAQHGVFLHVNYNWEVDYPLDKIIFPYSDYPSYPTKDIIYPNDKSPLEKLLDEFFDKQGTIEFFEKYSEILPKINFVTPFPNGFAKEAFKEPSKLTTLESWSDENLKNWKTYKVEDYHLTTGTLQKLSLRRKSSEKEIKNIIIYGITQMLRSNSFLRNKAVNWVLEDTPSNFDNTKVCQLLSLIWNGMRLLPFSDEEISTACGNLIYLHLISIDKLSRDKKEIVFSDLFGEGMIVGFSIKEGNGGTGFASNSSIINALGINFQDLFVNDLKDKANELDDLFRYIHNPKLMFDFTKFKAFFAKEIIPTQISLGNSYIIYNPANVAVFGIL